MKNRQNPASMFANAFCICKSIRMENNFTPAHGELLKQFMEDNNVVQKHVAQISNQDSSTVWRQLNGRTTRINLATLVAIAKLAGCRVNQLPTPN